VGTVSAPTATVDSGGGVQLELHTKAATVHADGGVSLTGGTESIRLDAPSGTISGNFGTVSNVGDGLFTVNGKPKPNKTVADNAENNRVIPVGSSILNNTMADTKSRVTPMQVVALTGQSGRTQPARSTPARAGDAVDRGQSVEMDLSPGNAKEQK
jgi:hypothetical protein